MMPIVIVRVSNGGQSSSVWYGIEEFDLISLPILVQAYHVRIFQVYF